MMIDVALYWEIPHSFLSAPATIDTSEQYKVHGMVRELYCSGTFDEESRHEYSVYMAIRR